ncbi:aspartate ammonia-lyase [Acetobacter okinawensis]|uniref:aspartate ammonia-lyase n=1 Tax=Acetobacter okinawensis TaxID=1076594 RepID=UPI00046FDE0E|nr:aspartate ammonia-lyase [Acetobacter okinawensis]
MPSRHELITEHLPDQRVEEDSLGACAVPHGANWGVHTQRALDNFPVTGVGIGRCPEFIRAFLLIKASAAKTNAALGFLSPEKADWIEQACQEILSYPDKYQNDFNIDVLQGGAGTSANMNVNEVIANVGLRLAGYEKGDYAQLHPNDDVNMSQSTNDIYPSAVKISLCFLLYDFKTALAALVEGMVEKAEEFKSVLKIGRTQLQDAVPMTLGQEFLAFARILEPFITGIEKQIKDLSILNIGGTAIGTGINCDPRYGSMVCHTLSGLCGFTVQVAPDLVAATSDVGPFVACSGMLKSIALKLSKICNDLRLLSSGPRAGLSEISLPSVQAGSSIMPGKVNPVIPEMVNQVAYMVVGYDTTIALCAEGGQLQLNAFEPAICHCLFNGIEYLKNAMQILNQKCVSGIKANKENCLTNLHNSTGILTGFLPTLGYDLCSRIAKQALEEGKTVSQILLEEKILTQKDMQKGMDAAFLAAPCRIQA